MIILLQKDIKSARYLVGNQIITQVGNQFRVDSLVYDQILGQCYTIIRRQINDRIFQRIWDQTRRI